ncbi:MAG: hypothetical protein U1E65_30880 [Myxococcota bacterium]
MRLPLAVLVLSLSLGCSPLSNLPTPTAARTYLVVVKQPGVSVAYEGYVFDAAPAELLAYFPEGSAALLLAYPEPLEALRFVPSTASTSTRSFAVDLHAGGAGRRIPRRGAALFAFQDRGWHSIDAFPESFDDARLAPLDTEACAQAGGCFDLDPLEPRCLLGCSLEAPAPPQPVVPVMAPALPRLEPCPAGWSIKTATLAAAPSGIATCRPPPIAAPVACGPGEAQAVGAAACSQLGPACPAQAFDAAVIADAFVDRTAAAGGDGSRARPYASLDEALRAGAPVIALARGDYTLHGDPTRALTLIGACASQTRLLLDSPVRTQGLSLDLSRLTVVSPVRARQSFGVIVGDLGLLRLTDVVFEDTTGPTLALVNARLEMDSVAFGRAGGGFVEDGALRLIDTQAVVNNLSIRSFQGYGVDMVRSRLVGQGVSVRGLSAIRGGSPFGFEVVEGSSLSLSRSELIDIEGSGIDAHNSTVSLDQVQLADLHRLADPNIASGLGIGIDTGTLNAVALSIERAENNALYVADRARAHLSDASLGPPRNELGGAIGCHGTRQCRIERTTIRGYRSALAFTGHQAPALIDLVIDGENVVTSTNVNSPIIADHLDRLDIERLASFGSKQPELAVAFVGAGAIRDVLIEPAGAELPGLICFYVTNSTLSVERAAVQDCSHGFYLGFGTFQASDLKAQTVVALPRDESSIYGFFLDRFQGKLSRAEIVDTDGYGIYALGTHDGTVLEDIEIRGVHGSAAQAVGLFFQWFPAPNGGSLSLSRARVQQADNAAIVVENAEGQPKALHLDDLSIEDTTGGCTLGRARCGAVELIGNTVVLGQRWHVRGLGRRVVYVNSKAKWTSQDIDLDAPSDSGVSGLISMEDDAAVTVQRFDLHGGQLGTYFEPPGVPSLSLTSGRIRTEFPFLLTCNFEEWLSLDRVIIEHGGRDHFCSR